MKKLLAILLSVVMVMSLVACGGDEKEDDEADVLGLYICTEVEVEGERIDINLIDDENEYSLELKKKGKGVITLENDEFTCTWELDGEDLHIVTDDESIDSTGTLKDGVIEIKFEETLWIYEIEGGKKSDKKEEKEEKEEEPSVLGMYLCDTVEVEGEVVDIEYIGEPEDYALELQEDGEGVLILEGEELDITWELDDEDLYLLYEESGEEYEYYGTLVEGVIVIDMEDAIWTFELSDGKSSNKDDKDDKGGKKENSGETVVIGDFESEYLGCEIMEDDDGETTLVVAFEFYNGSDAEECFAFAYYYEFMQDDEELDTTYIYYDPDSYDTLEDSAWEEIEPGESCYVFLTYILNDPDELVEVEFSDMYDEEFDYLTIDPADAEEGLVEQYYG